jgi:hypothetical protein
VNGLRIARWEAWAPGIGDADAWRAWARMPAAVPGEGRPDAAFVPALLRRRCDQLSRMMLEVAHRCCADDDAAQLACVFASRHGSFATLVSLLDDIANREPVSPAKFSHSVHNTQAGLFSIFAGNRRPSMSLAGAADSFAHGFLEAAGVIHRERGRPVLLVVGDEPVPAPLDRLADVHHGAYALALRIEPGTQLSLSLARSASGAQPAARARPAAREFLRGWLGGGSELHHAHPPRAWVWRRAAR